MDLRQITEIDGEGVQSMMQDFGRAFDGLGYPFVLEELQEGGDIGSAVANPMSHEDVMIIAAYLKEIAAELVKEPPSPERDRAMVITSQAWEKLKTLVR